MRSGRRALPVERAYPIERALAAATAGHALVREARRVVAIGDDDAARAERTARSRTRRDPRDRPRRGAPSSPSRARVRRRPTMRPASTCRMSVPTGPSLGSRVVRTCAPSLRRRAARSDVCVVVPAPSMPSRTMNRPCVMRGELPDSRRNRNARRGSVLAENEVVDETRLADAARDRDERAIGDRIELRERIRRAARSRNRSCPCRARPPRARCARSRSASRSPRVNAPCAARRPRDRHSARARSSRLKYALRELIASASSSRTIG